MTATMPTIDEKLSESDAAKLIATLAESARVSQVIIAQADHAARCAALGEVARLIRKNRAAIHTANRADLEAGHKAGLSPAFIDRLTLTSDSIEQMASGVEQIAELPDALGIDLARWTMPNGLDIAKTSTALGVIGIIYESRPNVTIDAACLCIKSGNAALLRCGRDSYQTSHLLADLIRQGLKQAGLPEDCVQMIPTPDRMAVGAMLGAVGLIDVIIPRGGKGLIARVQEQARVPIFAHLEGICHLYVSEYADLTRAVEICVNSKMRRVGICGAAEAILIDDKIVADHGQAIVNSLIEAKCEVRGSPAICQLNEAVIAATDQDWGCEYLAPIIAIKNVSGFDQAVAHINTYGSGHTESIITEDTHQAEAFFAAIDSAIVMVNASTQFADGNQFGMGAEIGIATGKLHARGPVGAAQLTSFKYIVRGNGQIRP